MAEGPELVSIPVNVWRIRVMFNGGGTVDFLTVDTGSSNMREVALDHFYGKRAKSDKDTSKRIEGVTTVGLAYVYTPELPDEEEPGAG